MVFPKNKSEIPNPQTGGDNKGHGLKAVTRRSAIRYETAELIRGRLMNEVNKSPFPNPKSQIQNPHSPHRNHKSALRNPKSAMVTAPDTSARRGGRITLLPIIFRSPDTGWAFGVLPQYFFRTLPESRPSSLRLDAYYTQNGQYHIQTTPEFWLRADTYRIAVKAVFKEWPTAFYGLGPNTISGDREPYTERFFGIQVEAHRRVLPGVYAGVRYVWRRTSIINKEEGGHLEAGGITGSEKRNVSGLALLLTWDTRDNIYYPMSGRYHQFEVQSFSCVLGSQYRFDLLKVDMRRYVALSKTQVLAFQGVAQHTTGAAPFWMLSGVGSVIRGYPIPRYVDKSLVAVQVEYRVVPIVWRLGVAVFAGVGQVADSLPAIRFDNLKYAVGLGLRFQLFKQEKMNLRLDYGFGRGSSGDYIDLPEAF